MKIFQRGLALLSLAAAVSVLAANPGRAQSPLHQEAQPAVTKPLAGDCTLTKTKYLVSTKTAFTNSKSFALVPESTISFNQSTKGCVIVRFSSEALSQSTIILVEALLDGSKTAHPPRNYFSANDANFSADRSMDFVFPNVSPGAHTVQMQFHSGSDSVSVALGYRTMILQYQ